MKIHEYQAKRLLRQSGVPVPEGELCNTADEARARNDAIADRHRHAIDGPAVAELDCVRPVKITAR